MPRKFKHLAGPHPAHCLERTETEVSVTTTSPRDICPPALHGWGTLSCPVPQASSLKLPHPRASCGLVILLCPQLPDGWLGILARTTGKGHQMGQGLGVLRASAPLIPQHSPHSTLCSPADHVGPVTHQIPVTGRGVGGRLLAQVFKFPVASAREAGTGLPWTCRHRKQGFMPPFSEYVDRTRGGLCGRDAHVPRCASCLCAGVSRSCVWASVPASYMYVCLFHMCEHKRTSHRENREGHGETERPTEKE